MNDLSGTTSFGGSISDSLKNVNLTIYDGATACATYGGSLDWNTQICAGEYFMNVRVLNH